MLACFLLLPARQSSSCAVKDAWEPAAPLAGQPVFPFPPSSLVCKWLVAFVAFASWGSGHTASHSPCHGEEDSWDKLGSCDVFPAQREVTPPSMNLHPWDAVDVLLGLPMSL